MKRTMTSAGPGAEATDSAAPATAIEFSDVRKGFGKNPVLQGLDLQISQGEVFALLGANGAGKTTSINILTTLIRPDSGTVLVGGIDVADEPNEAKRRFAVTGQSAAVDEYLSTRENLILLARLSGLSRREAKVRASRLAERLSLTSFIDTRVAALSGGMRRRLDLALSLVVQVDVLILDEPTTGLDTRSRRELWDEVKELAKGGTTVFLTTQYLEEADALADRIGLLDRGRLAGLGTPTELKAKVGQGMVAVHDNRGTTVSQLPTTGTVRDISSVLATIEPEFAEFSVSLRHPSLDDVFLSLTAPGPSAEPSQTGE